jgi:hypothetical protein
MKRAFCVRLEDVTEKWFSVSGAVLMEKAMQVKAGLKAVSEVQEPSIQGSPCPGIPQGIYISCFIHTDIHVEYLSNTIHSHYIHYTFCSIFDAS